MTRLNRSVRLGLAGALGVAVLIGARQLAIASDHQDTADVELNPTQDMTDLYVFPAATAGRTVLVFNSQPAISPAAAATTSFDKNLLYQIKIDNTGDAIEDKVIQVTFNGTGQAQQVLVRSPVAPSIKGAMNNVLLTGGTTVTGALNTTLGSASDIQVYAGVRDESFFIDLEQFFRIIPDRKPATGPLAALPATPSASAFRPAGQAVNYLAGFNVASIVIELPTVMLTSGGNAKIGVWGTISR